VERLVTTRQEGFTVISRILDSMLPQNRDTVMYPRGSFYPLSCMPTTRHYRITNTDFRPCSTCRSRSQAGLCVCTIIL